MSVHSHMSGSAHSREVYERRIKQFNECSSMVHLARLLLYDDTNRETERGIQLLERAIKQHQSADAMHSLAVYFYAYGNETESRRVVSLLERRLKSGECVDTLKLLAKVTLNGLGCRKDAVLAAQLYERALRLTNGMEVKQMLADVILRTPQLAAQKKRALKLYKVAIRRTDNPRFMNAFGLLYHHGTCNVNRSFPDAIKWYQLSIKKGDLLEAKCNLAQILANPHPTYEADLVQAVRILEDACEQRRSECALLSLAHLYDHYEQVRNPLRAIRLYRRAFRHYGTPAVRSRLIKLLLVGDEIFGPDYKRAVSFCLDDAAKGNSFGISIVCGMMWSGTRDMKSCPEAAADMMKYHLKHENSSDEYGVNASMLRFKKRKLEHELKLARSKSAKKTEPAKGLVHAIILSETGCESDLKLAEERLRQILMRDGAANDLIWMPIYIRNGKFPIPFRGDRRSMTEGMKRMGTIREAATLNLASLLLEGASDNERKAVEAVELLESLLGSSQTLVAVLNLGYVLWYGVGGVRENRKRAIELYRQEVSESNDAAARSVLAGALAQDDKNGDENVHNVWMSIREEVKDKKELLILSRMISQKP